MDNARAADAPVTDRQQRKREWRTALIVVSVMALVAGLVVSGVALAKWNDQNPGILRDERIAGHEVTELQVGDHNRETTLIRVRSGTTTADTLGLLKDLREHNRTAGSEGYIRRPYMLATEDGSPLWGLDDDFLVQHDEEEQVDMALWLANQEPSMTWSFGGKAGRAPGESWHVLIDVDEDYRDLRFLDEVMKQFPQHRVFLDYRDAPAVNLPAGHQHLIPNMEKLIDAWGRDPLTCGEIDRFSVTDLGDSADYSNDATSQQQCTIGLEIWFSVAEGDPAYVDAGDFYADGKPRSESRRREEQRLAREQRHRWQEIRDTLSEEARPLIPYADVTFFD